MKRTKVLAIILAGVLVSVLAFSLTACNDLEQGETSEVNNDIEETEDIPEETDDVSENSSGVVINKSDGGYVFTYNGYDVVLGSLAEDLLEALGEPQDTFQEESCGFHGIDYMYFYPGVRFNTFCPKDGEPDYILSIVFSDDTVETAEGAYIGMSQQEIEDIYGEPTEKGDVRIQYVKDGMSISFMFDNDVLDDITYYFDAADEFAVVG